MMASVKSKMALPLFLLVALLPFLIVIASESLRFPSTVTPDQEAAIPNLVVGHEKPDDLRFERNGRNHEEIATTTELTHNEKLAPPHIERSVLLSWLLGAPSPQESSSNSLQTPFDGRESGYGIMFEVETTSGSEVVLNSMDLNVDTITSAMISVYTIEGSFQGSENDRSVWKRIFSSAVTCSGNGNPTMLDPSEFASVKINPGAIRSFYVVLEMPDLRYSIGKELSTVVAQNSNILLRVGKGINLVFGNVIGNRAFNGVLHYEASSSTGDITQAFDNGSALSIGKPLQLTAPLNGGNFAFGIMFDIMVLRNLQVLSLDLNLPSGSIVTANIFTLTGTHQQKEINPDAWLLVCSVSNIIGNGLGVPTPIPSEKFSKLALMAGTRQAFYVTLSAAVLHYSDGNEVNRMFVENDHLQILEGTGVARPFFGGTFAPRIFNGAVHYQLIGEATSLAGREFGGKKEAAVVSHAMMGQLVALQLGMRGASGSYGVMFDVVADNQVFIAGMDIHTTVLDSALTAKVFTKEGSHVGFESDRGDGDGTAWKLIQDISAAGYGPGRLTPLPDFTDPVPVGSGKSQAFFISLGTAELRYDTADPGQTIVDGHDQNMKVLQGTGVGDGIQVFPSRIVNGAIRYFPTIDLLA